MMIIDPYRFASAPSAYAYFNPGDKGSAAVLSDADKVVTGVGGSGSNWARSVTSKNSGKWRVQAVLTNKVDALGFGFTTPGGVGSYVGQGGNQWCLFGNYGAETRLFNSAAGVSYATTFATNDVLDLLLDIPSGLAWWAKNGTVISGDPIAGTGAMATFGAGSTIFLAADAFPNLAQVRLRTDPAEMTGASISGFTDGWPI